MKVSKKIAVGVVMCILASQALFAKDSHILGRQCLSLAQELQEIAKTNNDDLCSGDILVASAYVQAAGVALSRDNTPSARVSLVYAKTELKEISHNRSYCAAISSKVKPKLAEVILIQSEIESGHEPDNTSDFNN